MVQKIVLVLSFYLFAAFPASAQDNVSAKRINNIRSCNRFPGANGGIKITACSADLPSSGGTADARGLEGAQTWSTNVFSSIVSSVDFKCGAATYTVSTTSTIPSNVHLIASQGCIFSVNSGITLTINGSLDGSSMSQHFAGNGTVTISNGQPVKPQWWPLVAGNISTNLQSAANALPSGGGQIDACGYTSSWIINAKVSYTVPTDLWFCNVTLNVTNNPFFFRASGTKFHGIKGQTIIKTSAAWTNGPLTNITITAVISMVNIANTTGNEGVFQNDFEIYGLTLDDDNQINGCLPKAVTSVFTNHVNIHDMTVKNFPCEGIWPSGGGIAVSEWWSVHDSYFDHVGYNGVVLGAASAITVDVNKASIYGNHFNYVNVGIGIDGTDVNIHSNVAANCLTTCFSAGDVGSSRASLSNNSASFTSTALGGVIGILINPTCASCVVANNTLYGTGSVIGIESACSICTVSNNSIVIDEQSTYGSGGIVVISGATTATTAVVGNTVQFLNEFNGYHAGVEFVTGSQGLLAGNFVSGCTIAKSCYSFDLQSANVQLGMNYALDGYTSAHGLWSASTDILAGSSSNALPNAPAGLDINTAQILTGSGVPAAGLCTANNIASLFMRTDTPDTTHGLYVCTSAGVWTPK